MGIVNRLGLEKSVILLAAVVSFVTAFLANISVALPLIARELAMSNIVQNWVATIFLLAIAALSIPLGKLTSKYGLNRSLLIGIIVTMIGVIISCFSFTSEILLLSRVVQGIGTAFINVASMALIVSAVPPETRGQALGLNIAGVYIGLSSAPVIGGIVIYYLGWQSIFYCMLPFLLFSAYLCYSLKDEWTMYDGAIDKFGSELSGDYRKGKETFKVDAVRNQITSLEILSSSGINNMTLYKPYDYAFKYVDIAKTPHMLVAGSTGSGKSVCINSILASILMRAKPDEVKLLLIDPKKVEFTVYRSIPHLLVPVVSNPRKAAGALSWAVAEMERRYKAFADNHVREIKSYNEQAIEKMPYIVIIIDELSDLMMVAKVDVEDAILRLAQKARAAGIHLILATQRPSVDVITGIVKANIPSRIAFAVSSKLLLLGLEFVLPFE